MIQLTIGNSYTFMSGKGVKAYALISDYCTHTVRQFISLYMNAKGKTISAKKYWKLPPAIRGQYRLNTEFKLKNVSYYNSKHKSFPTGWLPEITKLLRQENINFKLHDKRKRPQSHKLKDNLFPLRYYQKEAVKACIEKERGIIKHPTGSGKTVVIARLCSTLNLPTLIIIPNLILLNQTFDFLSSYIEKDLIGKIGEGIWEPNLFTVATAQTLWVRRSESEVSNFLKSVKVLIGDESHKINKNQEYLPNTWFRIAMKCFYAYYRYGFTATPGKDDSLQKKLLVGATGNIIHEVPLQELIDKGYLTDARIIIKKLNMKKVSGGWRKSYETNILNNEVRNKGIKLYAEEFAKQGKSVLIIVDEVDEHAMRLKDLIEDAEVLIGKDKKSVRDEKITNFRNGTKRILISTLLSEGFDFRGLDCVILAAGKKSNRLVAQRVGRALRTETGKKEAIILDFYDGDEGYLEKHSRERLEVYKELGFKIQHL